MLWLFKTKLGIVQIIKKTIQIVRHSLDRKRIFRNLKQSACFSILVDDENLLDYIDLYQISRNLLFKNSYEACAAFLLLSDILHTFSHVR